MGRHCQGPFYGSLLYFLETAHASGGVDANKIFHRQEFRILPIWATSATRPWKVAKDIDTDRFYKRFVETLSRQTPFDELGNQDAAEAAASHRDDL